MTINGKTVKTEQGKTVLEAAKGAGVKIPTMCSHDFLQPSGTCRMCMVEIEERGRKKLVTSCVYPVQQGLNIVTETPEIKKIRKMVVEMLWPASSRYGKLYGIDSSRFKNSLTDCTLCGRCVRYCHEVKKLDNVYFEGRGVDRHVAFVPGKANVCVFCRECFELCDSGWIVNASGRVAFSEGNE